MSAGFAALIAHVAFWGLLVYGWAASQLRPRSLTVFVLIWLAAGAGLPYVPYAPAAAMFPSVVAVLDIVLVLIVFRGDIPIT